MSSKKKRLHRSTIRLDLVRPIWPFWEGDYEKAFHRLVIAQMERFYCTTCEDRSRWLCQAVAHNQMMKLRIPGLGAESCGTILK